MSERVGLPILHVFLNVRTLTMAEIPARSKQVSMIPAFRILFWRHFGRPDMQESLDERRMTPGGVFLLAALPAVAGLFVPDTLIWVLRVEALWIGF